MKKMLLVVVASTLFIPLLSHAGEKCDKMTTKPILSVTGYGKVEAPPDRAVVTLGAVHQAPNAAEAQETVSKIMQKLMAKMADMGIPEDKIKTMGISLSPVFAGSTKKRLGELGSEQKITGYRAQNMIMVSIDDAGKVGLIIDAAIAAGANKLERVSFDLSEVGRFRKEALRKAAKEAQSKANIIADAMNVSITSVEEISEGGVSVTRPEVHMPRAMAMQALTPVQSGLISVTATVTVRYVIAPK